MKLFPALPLLLLSLPALAADGPVPQDVIQYRQSTMKALGGHMRALGSLAKKKVSFPRHADLHARAAADLSRVIGELFPAGTGPEAGKTEALPEVWKNGKKFASAVQDLQDKADAVVKAAAGDGAGLKPAVEALGESCGACHDTFKAKQ
jgi:cytochrome c556